MNDPERFPGREFPRDGPVTLEDGRQEHVIERILDERKRGGGEECNLVDYTSSAVLGRAGSGPGLQGFLWLNNRTYIRTLRTL